MLINCVQVVRDLDEASGGPSRSISQTALALAEAGCESHIITQQRGQKVIDLSPLSGHVTVHWLDKQAGSKEFANVWRSCIQPGRTVVHVQGLWSGINHLACRAARRDRIPYVIAPRGMLEPWAINHKKWKKKLAYWLYQRADLALANRIHATSPSEVCSIQGLGLNVPIELINNAVDIPTLGSCELPCKENSTKRALFLGRIHPVKGLENLIQAWCRVGRSDWQCWIVGPGDKEYLDKLRRLSMELGGASSILFKEAVSDSEKWQVIQNSDLCVQPSHSENFGMAIAESLGCSRPVITTRNTPWQDLETHRCGWWIADQVDALADALNHALSLSDAERNAMGHRGRQLIQDKYCWSASAQRLQALYATLLQDANAL